MITNHYFQVFKSKELVMKRIILILIPFILLAQSDPKLSICQYNSPPFQIDSVTGYCTELTREALDWMEVNYTIEKSRSYDVSKKALEVSRYDAVISFPLSESRNDKFHYPSEPFYTSPWFLFGKDEWIGGTFESLRGKRVALIQGFPYREEFLKTVGANYSAVLVENVSSAIDLYVQDSVDLVVISEATATYYSQNGNALKKLVETPVGEYKLTLIFSKKTIDQELVSAFSQTLKEIKESEVGEELRKKWGIKQ